MSMNVHISGTRVSTVITANGRPAARQRIKFDCWQTPTGDTWAIVTAPNPLEAYRQWVRAVSRPREETVCNYRGKRTLDGYYPVLGTRVIDPGEIHIQELDSWLQLAELDGYEIEVYEL